LITFLSDFGLEDDFVGTCHGVMKTIAPEAEILDITHGIQRHGVLQGAIVLANTLPYVPKGVHLAVVDPGVGGGRRSLVLRSGDGRLFVGPDNGLLVPPPRSSAESTLRTRSRTGSTCSTTSPRRSTDATCSRRWLHISWTESRWKTSVRGSSPTHSSGSRFRSPTSRTGGSAPRASTSTASGT
jgi:hypothetical protein